MADQVKTFKDQATDMLNGASFTVWDDKNAIKLKDAYTTGRELQLDNKTILGTLAPITGKTALSIRCKLSSMRVYIKDDQTTDKPKRGSQTKIEKVTAIRVMLESLGGYSIDEDEAHFDTLAKSNSAALDAILIALTRGVNATALTIASRALDAVQVALGVFDIESTDIDLYLEGLKDAKK